MNATGPTKLSTIKLARDLKKEKQNIWKDLAKRITGIRRNRAEVNLSKLSKMAKKNKGKILIVPGKVLGSGLMEEKATVAALSFSEKAEKEINQKGKTLTLSELVKSKEKPSQMVIIK